MRGAGEAADEVLHRQRAVGRFRAKADLLKVAAGAAKAIDDEALLPELVRGAGWTRAEFYDCPGDFVGAFARGQVLRWDRLGVYRRQAEESQGD